MNFVLISPRLAVQKGDFLGSGVPYWPVELAVVAAFLKEKVSQVHVMDLFGDDPTALEDMPDHYLQGRPFKAYEKSKVVSEADVFVLYAISYMSHQELLSTVRRIERLYPQAKIVVLENSQAVTAYSLQAVQDDFFEAGADTLICGEIYWNWDEIESFLVCGIDTEIPENLIIPERPAGHNLRRIYNKKPTYPYPAWELFNLEGYWSIPYSHGPKRTRKYLPILTSRGCPYPCDFCVVPETNNTRWRARSPNEIVDEIIHFRDLFGIKYFQVEDLNPTVNSKRWKKICELLVERNVQILFSLVSGTKAETVKLEDVPLYAQAGCCYISISPESGSSDILDCIGKPFDHQYALDLIKVCHQYSIYTQACLLVGHPAERLEDHRRSCRYLAEMVRAGLDEVAVFIVSSVAGSRIYQDNNIQFNSTETLPSFSPQGRAGWKDLSERRQQLIRIFFAEKLKQGTRLWLQGFRAVLGYPRTKMENLPRRAVFIFWQILKCRVRNFGNRFIP